MSAQKGSLVLIKVGNGADPEIFSTVGGLRLSSMMLNQEQLDASNLESGAWRQLLGGAGKSSLRLSGSGMFTDSASEETLRGYAFAGSVNNYQFIFANGDYVSGPFLVASYERSGSYDAEELYALSLESAGAISFTSA